MKRTKKTQLALSMYRTKKYGKDSPYQKMNRRKAIALDLLMAAEHVQRHRATEALRIARKLV